MVEDEEVAYISHYVVAILKSPTWVSPIAKFVDDNCVIFEDVEENKIEYTFVHNAFKSLVEDLLVAHLCEMSIGIDQFMRFCAHGLLGNSEVDRSLVEQLISCEDFLVFKAMMVKRMRELNREVIGAPLCVSLQPSSGSPLRRHPTMADEGAEEAERVEAERCCMEAELQLAHALSIQLEKRLQLMDALEKMLELESQIYALRADALEDEVAEERAAEQAKPEAAQTLAPLVTAPPRAASLTPIQPAPLIAPMISTTVAIRPLKEARLEPLEPPRASGHLGPNEILALERKKAEVAAQKERADRASTEKRRELVRVAAAAPSFEGAPVYDPQHGLMVPPVTPVPAAPVASVASRLQPTEEEKQARAEHLKRQRALLIEKKNQERENQLTAFQMQNGATNASIIAQQKCSDSNTSQDAGRNLARELSGQAQAHSVAPVAVNAEAAAAEMRKMLTQQLKASFR